MEPGTWVNYETDARKRLIPAFGNRRLGALETHLINDWLVEAAEVGDCAPKTLNNTLGTLSSALSYAAREGPVPANAALAVELLPLAHRE